MADVGTADAAQYKIAASILKQYERTPFAYLLLLGDLVYKSGKPKNFKKCLEKPYGPLLDLKDETGKPLVKIATVVGNADVKSGDENLQRHYMGVNRPYYRLQLRPKDLPSVDIFFLDTTLFTPQTIERYMSPAAYILAELQRLQRQIKRAEQTGEDTTELVKKRDRLLKIKPGQNPSPIIRERAKQQLTWLDEELKNSKAKIKIVSGHHSLQSPIEDPKHQLAAQNVRKQLLPVLMKHHIPLYLCGHEHVYEASLVKEKSHDHTFTQIVSGAGGELAHDYIHKPEYQRCQIKRQNHFSLFEITPTGLQYELISRNGKRIGGVKKLDLLEKPPAKDSRRSHKKPDFSGRPRPRVLAWA